MPSPRLRSLVLALSVALTVAWVLYVVSLVADEHENGLAADLTYNGLLFGAAGLCLLRAVAVREERAAWGILAGGLVAWVAADIYYTAAYANVDSAPFPGPADAGWLVFYPACYVSLVLLLRARVRHFSFSLWLDGVLGALTVAAVAAALVFQPIADAGSGSTAAVATNLAYPLADLLLLGFAVAAIALTGWRPGRMWLVLAAGLALSAVADSWYLYDLAVGTYEEGGVLDALWPGSALLIAAGAWQPTVRTRGTIDGWRMLAIPAGFMTVALGLLVLDHFERITELALWLAAGALLAGIVRMGLTFRENLQMLRASRHEATTDVLTGLANRRLLMRDLNELFECAESISPHVLVLFDLNGFKRYNDTYGHPAGDELLIRLSHSFKAVVSDGGRAYRLGGDEFCALLSLDGSAGDVEGLAARAAEGLCEQGEGFDIDAAWGEVKLPEAAADASEALRIADRRMYARKHGGRASASRQTRDVLLTSLKERESALHDHLQDVGGLARSVALEFGMPPEQVDEVARAAELHDVGKIAIPDAILNKPGPLDDEEWAFMRQHTLIGERILGAAPALRPVAVLVRSSHERWDGSGYPDGLAGEEIPLGARIVAVCDAFDAMTSDRPYRASLSQEVALEELRRGAWAQFDGDVVDAFVRVAVKQPTPEAPDSAVSRPE